MTPVRALLSTLLFVGASMSLVPATAMAQQLCAVDLNGNGDAADDGETASCHLTGSGGWMSTLR